MEMQCAYEVVLQSCNGHMTTYISLILLLTENSFQKFSFLFFREYRFANLGEGMGGRGGGREGESEEGREGKQILCKLLTRHLMRTH